MKMNLMSIREIYAPRKLPAIRYVAIAYQYLNSCLATVPQVLFTNLRDNITKARYQTLPDLVVKGNFPLFFIKLVWGNLSPVVYSISYDKLHVKFNFR